MNKTHSMEKGNFPAFPRVTGNGASGLTIRDYFAAAAMQGLLSKGAGVAPEALAREAYVYADALLKSKEK